MSFRLDSWEIVNLSNDGPTRLQAQVDLTLTNISGNNLPAANNNRIWVGTEWIRSSNNNLTLRVNANAAAINPSDVWLAGETRTVRVSHSDIPGIYQVDPETDIDVQVRMEYGTNFAQPNENTFNSFKTAYTVTDGLFTWTTPRINSIADLTVDAGIKIAEIEVEVNPRYDGTLYVQNRRADGQWQDLPSHTVTDGGGSLNVDVLVQNLFPNRAYEFRASREPSFPFDESRSVTYTTSNPALPGVLDPSLTFNQMRPFWRSTFGLADFDLIVEQNLPAGFSDLRYSNPEAPREVTVQELMHQLARRVVGGAWERADGSWRIVSKRTWDAQPVKQTFRRAEQGIITANARARAREEIFKTRWRYRIYDDGQAGAPGQPATVDVNVQYSEDEFQESLHGHRTVDISDYFIYLPIVPGALADIDDYINDGVPVIAEWFISGALKDDVVPSDLWIADVGDKVAVELRDASGSLSLHTGVIATRGLKPRRGVAAHKYSMWVLESERIP